MLQQVGVSNAQDVKAEGRSPEATAALAKANQLNQQAFQFFQEGQYQAAISPVEAALQIQQQILGDRHPDVASSLNNLALMYAFQGRYEQAEPLYLQALDLRKSLLGNHHPQVATSLNNLAGLYVSQGRYEKAEPMYLQALDLRKSLLGDRHPQVPVSLNNLAGLYLNQGRYEQAEPLYLQALDLRKSLLGDRHLDVASSLHHLAGLYMNQGRYEKAEPLILQALDLRKSLLGDRHLDVASSLNSLAALYIIHGRYEQAESFLIQAIDLRKSLLGDRDPNVASSLTSLAGLYMIHGRYEQAELLYLQALDLLKSLVGDRHSRVAFSLHNLAGLYTIQGRYEQAEPLYLQALDLRKSLLGDRHLKVASSLTSLATLYARQGRYEQAITSLTQGLNIEETNLTTNLELGAEAQKRDYIAILSHTTNEAISLHLQTLTTNHQSAQLALTTIFRRKGRILDVTSNSLATLRQNLTPADQQLLDKLADRTSQLSSLIYSPLIRTNPDQYRTTREALIQEVSELQSRLARRSTTFRQQIQPITLEAVQPIIPSNATLVEITRYKPFNLKAKESEQWGTPRYAAYLLTRDGKIAAVDLGEAASIDQLTAEFRAALQRPNTSAKSIGRKLDAAIMQPLRTKLGQDIKYLLISPDSHLNLIPFAALVDQDNRYLVESYEISYLTSGRDLLRLQPPETNPNTPVLLANPNYTTASNTIIATNPTTLNSTQRTADLTTLSFGPLPGTTAEAQAIAPKLKGVTLFTDTQATETAIKQIQSPRILHIATHGFFLQDLPQPQLQNSRGLLVFDDRAGGRPYFKPSLPIARPYNPNDNPLLRSGLALAGANSLNGGHKNSDGILTALEASQLNFRGTQLVVLSACETGVGDVANGEGVYGLRRAFTLAGAQTQMISLWKVSDAGTKDLMVRYYDKLLTDKKGRSQALLETQRELLKDPQYQHPYYWASFILSGNWKPLPKAP
ncbi:CHAT domain-containing protein [filamentous cyanobacterium LEGE 11480]|uniref:CHAT domain-containing protein n=2 Tax=Romeriopsis TaxID=2992131 RepID=A0A928VTT6_9CYAN|nr:CHAT domain-containing protein [Romeriopsis navalis LEGE 11480]